jgi:hypothetical protein
MFKRNDWVFGMASLVIGGAVLFLTQNLSGIQSADPAGPKVLPSVIAWLMIAIGATHVAGAYMLIRKEPWKAENSTHNPTEKDGGNFLRLFLMCLVCGIYIFLLEEVGYLLVTPFLMIAIMAIVGVKSIPKLLGTSIATTLLLFGIFYFALRVNLPLGYLEALFYR